MPDTRTWSYWLLMAATSAWLLAILSPGILGSFALAGGDWVRATFAAICHQLPERSFSVAGETLAVCARCTGLYLGFGLGLILLPRLPALTRRLLKQPRLLILFLVPMTLDLLVDNTHGSRLLSGMAAAFPISLFVWLALQQLQATYLPYRQRRSS